MSLQVQSEQINAYAKQKHIQILEQFCEEGESAKTTERPELQKLLKYVAVNKNRIDFLLIHKIDRLARDTGDYQTLRAVLHRYGVKIISITEPIDDNPVGRFLENTMSNIAQFDNEIRGERAKAGTQQALKNGRWVYNAPYGYTKVHGKGKATVVINEKEARIVRKIYEYLLEGTHTAQEARIYAHKLGLRGENKKLYTKSSFYRIIRKPIYKGFINVPNMSVYIKGSFPAIVEPKVFDRVQDILDGRNNNPPVYRKIHPDFPLRGTIICPKCDKKMTANWSKGKYPYYKCSTCKNVNIPRKKVDLAFKDFLEKVKLDEKIIELTKIAIIHNWKTQNQNIVNEIKSLKKRQAEISNEETEIAKQNRDGVIPLRLTQQLIAKLENEYTQISMELQNFAPPEEQEEELITYATDFLTNICSVWGNLEPEYKDELQKFLFFDGLKFDGEKFATNQKSLLSEVSHYITIGSVSESEAPETRTPHQLLKRQLLYLMS